MASATKHHVRESGTLPSHRDTTIVLELNEAEAKSLLAFIDANSNLPPIYDGPVTKALRSVL